MTIIVIIIIIIMTRPEESTVYNVHELKQSSVIKPAMSFGSKIS